MASIKFISTTSERINSIPVAEGNLLFSRDDRVIYLDSSAGRTSYQQIIQLSTEEQRKNLSTPINGAFYFVLQTKVLWHYSSEDGWTNITTPPESQIVFAKKVDFPDVGEEDVIYCDGVIMYRYLGEYVKIDTGASPEWVEF